MMNQARPVSMRTHFPCRSGIQTASCFASACVTVAASIWSRLCSRKSTGNEIVDPTQTPLVRQIRNSNAQMLAANVRRDGGTIVETVRVPDAEAAVVAALRSALGTSDLVFTKGGASAGERDNGK